MTGDAEARNVVKGFIVEFFGCLIPGVAFWLALIPALLLPMFSTFERFVIFGKTCLPDGTNLGSLSIGTILFLVVPGLMGFLAFAYIAGHLFYRQDPKHADQASFNRLPRHVHSDGMVRALQGGEFKVEFPYHHLRQYLIDRGILYLAELVPWDGEKDFTKRAKHFANALKIRIRIENADAFSTLARNEAHVRLSSSMWYVSRMLLVASSLGTVMVSVRMVLERSFCASVLLPACTLALACFAKWAIESALHYQREREVLFILETAYWLRENGKVPKIFYGILPESAGSPTSHST